MLAPSLVEKIRILLSEKTCSQREIARQLGVSRGSVGAIARGKRPDYTRRNRRGPNEIRPPVGRPTRCPTCGSLVQMPCLRCQLLAMRHRERGRSANCR